MCRSRDTPPGAYPPTFARGGPNNNDNDVSSSVAGRDKAGAGIAIRPDHRWRSFRGEWSMEKVLDLYKY